MIELLLSKLGILRRGYVPDIPCEIQMMIGVEKPNLQVGFVQFTIGGTGTKLLKFFGRFG